jgi:anti-anti-sigma factor
MVVERSVVGSLTLYSRRPEALSAQLRTCLDLLADQAGHGWSSLVRQRELGDASEHMVKALTSRPVIDQAIGVLMAESRCTAGAAFDMLRRHSSNNNRKLRDVAAEIVTRASGAPPETPHGFTFRDGTSTRSLPTGPATGRLTVTGTDAPRGVRLAGEADATERTTLRDALGELFVRPPAPGDDLVVDVADLEFIDVACLRLLVQGADLAHERGSRLVLRSPSASLLSLLESTWSAAPMHLDVEDGP